MKTADKIQEVIEKQLRLEEDENGRVYMDEVPIIDDEDLEDEDLEEVKETKEAEKEQAEDKPPFSDYYDEIDKKHESILEKCAVLCRSDKSGFTDETRLDVIRELLEGSEYEETYTGAASIWVKGGTLDPSKECILISSHADTVQAIQKPFSKLSDDGYYKGTYDNIGTNAAAVISMLEGDLPKNVVFAFTSEEETGRFKGIKSAVATLEEAGIRNPVCIALDVTYDGYDEGALYTIENASKNREFLTRLKDAAFASEPSSQTFMFVRRTKKAYPEGLDEKYISKSMGDCDEAFGYNEMGLCTCSLCLPTEGAMHSDTGLTTRQPVFEGYVTSLQCMTYALTNTHKELLEAKRIEKQTLADRTAELLKEEAKKPKPSYYSSQTSSYGSEYSPKYGYYSQSDYEDAVDYYNTHGYAAPSYSYDGVDDIEALSEELSDEYRDMQVMDSYDETEGYTGPNAGKSDKKRFVADMMYSRFPALYSIYESLKEQFSEVWEDARREYEMMEHDLDEMDDDERNYGGYVDDLEELDDL